MSTAPISHKMDSADDTPQPPLDPTDPASLKQTDVYAELRKLGILVALVALCVAVIHLTDLRDILDHTSRLKNFIGSQGIWGPLYFVGAATVLILVGLPRLIFCVLGGVLFGFVDGLIYSQVATLAGAYGTFLVARWGTRKWVERLIHSENRIYKMLENPTVLTVFLSRQLPSGGVFISAILGFSTVSHRNFLLGSLLGFLPEAIPAVLLGSGAGKSSMLLAFAQLLTAAAVLLLAGVVILRLSRAYKENLKRRQKKCRNR